MTAPRLDGDCLAEREAFEAWAKQYGRIFLDRQPHGPYMHAFTQEAWVGWQAHAAASKQGGKAEGWMPIETAPKDGREFLCLTETIGCAVIFWDCYEEPPRWANGFDDTAIVPTHWQPTPPAPAAQPQGDKSHE